MACMALSSMRLAAKIILLLRALSYGWPARSNLTISVHDNRFQICVNNLTSLMIKQKVIYDSAQRMSVRQS